MDEAELPRKMGTALPAYSLRIYHDLNQFQIHCDDEGCKGLRPQSRWSNYVGDRNDSCISHELHGRDRRAKQFSLLQEASSMARLP